MPEPLKIIGYLKDGRPIYDAPVEVVDDDVWMIVSGVWCTAKLIEWSS